MHFVFKMNLEIIDTHLWTRGIELAWTVFAFNPRVIHKPNILWRRLVGADADWLICGFIDRSVAHGAFEIIVLVGLLLLKAKQGLGEPFRRRRLRGCQYE